MCEIFVVSELLLDTFMLDRSNNVCKYGYIGGNQPIRRATSYSVGGIARRLSDVGQVRHIVNPTDIGYLGIPALSG